MLIEIVLLYFLCKKIIQLAEQKNVPKTRWVMTTIFYWILGSSLANVLLIYALGIDISSIKKDEIIKMLMEHSMYFMFAGLSGGYLGYLFTRKRIEDLPDAGGTIE